LTKRFTLSPRTKNILEKKGFSLVCPRCGLPIQVGDVVTAQRAGRHSQHYHTDCWEAMQL